MNIIYTCIKIFFARILDVSLNTIRTTFVLRGKTIIVAILAFLEITIWFLVARTALNTKLNILIVISYSGGYTTGTIIGTIITNYFIKTNIEVLIISNNTLNINTIKNNNYGITQINNNNNKNIYIIETNKKRLKKLISIINKLDSKALITVKETRQIINGYI